MGTHLAILPSDVLDNIQVVTKFQVNSNDSGHVSGRQRFLRLPHPRTNVLSLFLPYHQSGRSSILEVQAISPPHERSWFLSEGDIVQDGRLLLLTPVDSTFLLIPFFRLIQASDGLAGNFRPLDDILDDMRDKLLNPPTDPTDTIYDLSSNDLSRFFSLDCVKSAAKRLCEMKEITPDLTVYRYSSSKALEYMRFKVMRLQQPQIFDASRTMVRNLAKGGLMEDGKEALLQAGRQKAACDVLSQYLSKEMHEELLASYDFTALNAYQLELLSENASSASAHMSAIEAKESTSSATETADTGGKKRKGAVKASHGVEKLKRANTKGMAKLSSFFQKAG